MSSGRSTVRVTLPPPVAMQNASDAKLGRKAASPIAATASPAADDDSLAAIDFTALFSTALPTAPLTESELVEQRKAERRRQQEAQQLQQRREAARHMQERDQQKRANKHAPKPTSENRILQQLCTSATKLQQEHTARPPLQPQPRAAAAATAGIPPRHVPSANSHRSEQANVQRQQTSAAASGSPTPLALRSRLPARALSEKLKTKLQMDDLPVDASLDAWSESRRNLSEAELKQQDDASDAAWEEQLQKMQQDAAGPPAEWCTPQLESHSSFESSLRRERRLLDPFANASAHEPIAKFAGLPRTSSAARDSSPHTPLSAVRQASYHSAGSIRMARTPGSHNESSQSGGGGSAVQTASKRALILQARASTSQVPQLTPLSHASPTPTSLTKESPLVVQRKPQQAAEHVAATANSAHLLAEQVRTALRSKLPRAHPHLAAVEEAVLLGMRRVLSVDRAKSGASHDTRTSVLHMVALHLDHEITRALVDFAIDPTTLVDDTAAAQARIASLAARRPTAVAQPAGEASPVSTAVTRVAPPHFAAAAAQARAAPSVFVSPPVRLPAAAAARNLNQLTKSAMNDGECTPLSQAVAEGLVTPQPTTRHLARIRTNDSATSASPLHVASPAIMQRRSQQSAAAPASIPPFKHDQAGDAVMLSVEDEPLPRLSAATAAVVSPASDQRSGSGRAHSKSSRESGSSSKASRKRSSDTAASEPAQKKRRTSQASCSNKPVVAPVVPRTLRALQPHLNDPSATTGLAAPPLLRPTPVLSNASTVAASASPARVPRARKSAGSAESSKSSQPSRSSSGSGSNATPRSSQPSKKRRSAELRALDAHMPDGVKWQLKSKDADSADDVAVTQEEEPAAVVATRPQSANSDKENLSEAAVNAQPQRKKKKTSASSKKARELAKLDSYLANGEVGLPAAPTKPPRLSRALLELSSYLHNGAVGIPVRIESENL